MYLVFARNSLNFTVLLQGEKLEIKAISSTFNSWVTTITSTHPLGTGRDIPASALFEVLRRGLEAKDPDVTLELPLLPTKEQAVIAMRVLIRQRFLPPDEILISLDPQETSETRELREMILAQGRIIEAQGRIIQAQGRTLKDEGRAIRRLESIVEKRNGFSELDDSAFSCSSFWQNSSMCSAASGRLNNTEGAQGWCAGTTLNQWIQADLGCVKEIYAVSTQGRGHGIEKVTKYRLCGSLDGYSFVDIGEFTGNSNCFAAVSHTLPEVVQYRFVRLVPLVYHGHISLRWDVHYE